MNSLRGLTILVTRPDPSGTELCELIDAHGGHAIHFPTIAFSPPSDSEAFKKSVAALGQMDWLVFISPQAVYSSIVAIRHAWPDFPPAIRFAAVGEGTANALKAAGYLVSAFPGTEWNSEGLLKLPEFQSLAGKKIAIVRGQGGREFLANALIDRGAKVEHVVAYQRTQPESDVKPFLDLLKQKRIDVIICTSFEGVQNLKRMIGEKSFPYLRDVPVIVVSERIKMLARDLDFQTIWVAHNASHPALLAALAQKRDEICQIKQKK